VGAGLALGGLAGAGIYLSRGRRPASAGLAGPPIRLGLLYSETGTMAASERPLLNAVTLAVEELNAAGGLLGRPVELVVADGRSSPAGFAAQAVRLIERERVVALVGCWTSACRKAVREVVEPAGSLLLYPLGYEGLEDSPNIVYMGDTPNQSIVPAAKFLYATVGPRAFHVGSDYVYPRVAGAIIGDTYRALGGQIVGEAYLPLGSSDVASAVAAIREARPDVIFNTINGDTNIPFFRALRQGQPAAGRPPAVSFALTAVEIRALGPDVVTGDYAAWSYYQSLDTSTNRDFLARFRRRFDPRALVTDPSQTAYVAAHVWGQAVTQAGRSEPAAVRDALRGMSFEAPEGPLRIDPENLHTWRTVRIAQVQPDGTFRLELLSGELRHPEPFPTSRSRLEWQSLLDSLYRGWGGQWEAPAGSA
jgi:urea transport system substrate-binding protein